MAKERDDEKMSMVEYETHSEYKDEYIDHLKSLLEPHLSPLPTEVVDEIHKMPEEIGVFVTPTDH